MLDFDDYLYIVCNSIIKSIIITFGIFILSNLIKYNHDLGIFIADNMQIPYDFALTINSLGFVNNIMLVFTMLELIFIGIIINKLDKNKIINRLFSYLLIL